MSMIKQCAEPGCETLTMGPLCVEHELLLGVKALRTPVKLDMEEVALTLSRRAGTAVRTASEPVAAAPLHR